LSREERRSRRDALGLRADQFAFLNVSAMTYNKGVDLLIVAFCRLRQKYRDVALILKDQSNLYGVTAAGLIADLARQLPQLLTADALASIHVVSSNLTLADLRLLYGSADAYVSPYRAEGFNLPPLEAAACGLPVAVTRGGPSDDYFDPCFALQLDSRKITSDELGVYLEPHPDHLVATMEALLARPLDGAKGRAFVSERFSWKSATRRLVDVFAGAR
jgi:glycosyltransferase involved in cell wall biosynthesis